MRIWKPALVGALMFGTGLSGVAVGARMVPTHQAEAQPAGITAGRFELTGVSPAYPPGSARATLAETDDGSALLTFPGTDGAPRLTAGMASVGEPVITLRDANGTARAVLALSEDGSPHLVFLDKDGYLIWSAP
jgi:hypothetical protein